jgi:hypothetical protein
LTPAEFLDESIYRQTRIIRYAAGQQRTIRRLVEEMTDMIAKYVIHMETLETKGIYVQTRKYIREQCIKYRHRCLEHLRKEISGLIKEESEWLYQNSPNKLVKADVEKIERDILFEAYSYTDNIDSYFQRIFNQIFQLWNNQLAIAYRTKQDTKDMVKFITGKGYK